MNRLQASIDELRNNPRQFEAFELAGNVVVLAPPGSGKTKLLTTRLARDLQIQIQAPQGAACITLTRAAARELRRRLYDLGIRHEERLFIGTVHSFALQSILRSFSALYSPAARILQLDIISASQMRASLLDAADSVTDDPRERRLVAATVDTLRKRMAGDDEWQLAGQNVNRAKQALERSISARGLTTFEEVVSTAADLLEQVPLARKALAARFPNLYVDEYQDLSPALHRIVLSLCLGSDPLINLFAVGDPDQSILGFTGSRPELLAELAESNSVRTVWLNVNYRSGDNIIAHAVSVLRQPRDYAGTGEGGMVDVELCRDGFAHQARQAVVYIRTLLDSGTPADEIAIACPENAHCVSIMDLLRENAIPAIGRSDLYPETAANVFCELICLWASEDGGTSFDEIMGVGREAFGSVWSVKAQLDLLSRVQELNINDPGSAKALVDMVLAAHIQEFLRRQGRADDVEAFASLCAWVEKSSWSVANWAENRKPKGRVMVSTWSSIKGLEFDEVLLLGVDDGRMPHFSARTPSQMAEQRRAMYVLLTRARHRVRIFYSGYVEWSTGNVGRNGPSRFLREAGLL